jgi:hypothetical protein
MYTEEFDTYGQNEVTTNAHSESIVSIHRALSLASQKSYREKATRYAEPYKARIAFLPREPSRKGQTHDSSGSSSSPREALDCSEMNGVISYVVETGKTLNIRGRSTDELFNKEAGTRPKYTTKTLLCTPIRDYAGLPMLRPLLDYFFSVLVFALVATLDIVAFCEYMPRSRIDRTPGFLSY